MPTEKSLKFLIYFIFIGCFSLLLITIFASGGFAVPKNGGGWFYEYQTTFTGLIGLITLIIIGYQYLDNIARKRLSARAKMNDALSVMCRYSKTCFNSVLNNSKPPLNVENIEILKDAIEFLDKDSADSVYELIIHYQVHNSRLESKINTTDNYDKKNRLYDSVKLYALSARLFGYARKSDEYSREVHSVKNLKLTASEMLSSFRAITDVLPDIIEYSEHAVIYDELIQYIKMIHDK